MDISYLTLTTEIDAVNTMLGTIGESPVSSLEGTLPVDALIAKAVLGEVMRDVQTEGWHFNTENDYPLTVDEDGEIVVPSNCVAVDLDPKTYFMPVWDIVQRGNKLYNRYAHTYKFEATLYASVTLLLAFDQLPETARRYITIRASRQFCDRVVGSGTLHDFSKGDEDAARIALRHMENDTADYNILRSALAWQLRR